MAGTVNFNLDQLDDVVLPDGIPAFDGGQFSNLRGNLLQPTQSKLLGNCDIDKLGKLRTRRGTIRVGTTTPANVAGKIIQGLTSYQTVTANYVVAAHNAKLWAFNGTTWIQIGLGGTADRENIFIARTGAINQSTVPAGYPMGTTDITVDLVGGATPAAPGGGRVEVGEKLYFMNNLRTAYYEYTIAAVTPAAPSTANVTAITLEAPGLVFDVKDNWIFTVLRPAKVKNPTPGNRYAGGTTTIGIDTYTGQVNDGEKFVIKSENITHTISSHVGTGPTTSITFDPAAPPGGPALQADWAADDANVSVMFAQGNDSLFFTDGTGPFYAWTGGIPTSPTVGGGTLMKIGSHSLLDNLAGNFVQSRTTPPQDVRILVWFQNRLIASGIASEPDAVYYSDFFDGTSWDADFQKNRIGGGESDPITGCVPWSNYYLLVYKKNSIYIENLDPAQNPVPDDPTLLVASYGVTQIHKKIGCPAPLSAVQVGGGSTTPGSDIFFVDGDKKVHSVRRVMAAENQQEIGQAMSLPIQDILDTINIDHIDLCNAIYHNEHYILGFPSNYFPGSGGLLPNIVVSYNLLTQSWCGVWSWTPTCFALRTDLGSYSRMIFGDVNGNVVQWLDDISLFEENTASYQDLGIRYGGGTQIVTRAITFGDYYSFKTGLSVEFEFDESTATAVTVQVILDGVVQKWPPFRGDLTLSPFTTLTETRLRLPFTLPVTLPSTSGLMRRAFDLQRYGTWREMQFKIFAADGKLAIRSIRVTGFMDTLRLQTVPDTGVSNSEGDIIISGPGPGTGVPGTGTGGP